jgi:uncharacterized protein YkwD
MRKAWKAHLLALMMGLWLTGCGGNTSSANLAYPGASELDQFTLALLNGYRAQAGVKPLALDATLSQFATDGTSALMATGVAHQHFIEAISTAQTTPGLCGLRAENQAPGWPGSDGKAVVAAMLRAMMDEGPGGGHHDNILNPSYLIVGVSTIATSDGYYLTNDFGIPCSTP